MRSQKKKSISANKQVKNNNLSNETSIHVLTCSGVTCSCCGCTPNMAEAQGTHSAVDTPLLASAAHPSLPPYTTAVHEHALLNPHTARSDDVAAADIRDVAKHEAFSLEHAPVAAYTDTAEPQGSPKERGGIVVKAVVRRSRKALSVVVGVYLAVVCAVILARASLRAIAGVVSV